MKKIGVIAAMEKELLPLLSGVGKTERVATFPYAVSRVTVGERELYFTQSGIGEISAGAATQYLISAFGCEEIWNFGVVGGLTDEMDYNHVSVVKRVVHYAFDLTAIDPVEKGQYVPEKSRYILADANLYQKASALLGLTQGATLASADKFVADASEKEQIAKEFDADICDMEGAGIALICEKNNVPFLMVKAVSDTKNDGAKFNELVQGACQTFATVLQKLL